MARCRRPRRRRDPQAAVLMGGGGGGGAASGGLLHSAVQMKREEERGLGRAGADGARATPPTEHNTAHKLSEKAACVGRPQTTFSATFSHRPIGGRIQTLAILILNQYPRS